MRTPRRKKSTFNPAEMPAFLRKMADFQEGLQNDPRNKERIAKIIEKVKAEFPTQPKTEVFLKRFQVLFVAAFYNELVEAFGADVAKLIKAKVAKE